MWIPESLRVITRITWLNLIHYPAVRNETLKYSKCTIYQNVLQRNLYGLKLFYYRWIKTVKNRNRLRNICWKIQCLPTQTHKNVLSIEQCFHLYVISSKSKYFSILQQNEQCVFYIFENVNLDLMNVIQVVLLLICKVKVPCFKFLK